LRYEIRKGDGRSDILYLVFSLVVSIPVSAVVAGMLLFGHSSNQESEQLSKSLSD
jgi:hypothetical protein